MELLFETGPGALAVINPREKQVRKPLKAASSEPIYLYRSAPALCPIFLAARRERSDPGYREETTVCGCPTPDGDGRMVGGSGCEGKDPYVKNGWKSTIRIRFEIGNDYRGRKKVSKPTEPSDGSEK
jgi:hypothetical protein